MPSEHSSLVEAVDEDAVCENEESEEGSEAADSVADSDSDAPGAGSDEDENKFRTPVTKGKGPRRLPLGSPASAASSVQVRGLTQAAFESHTARANSKVLPKPGQVEAPSEARGRDAVGRRARIIEGPAADLAGAAPLDHSHELCGARRSPSGG